ncbi:MAG: FGGY family carbohydrate kinase [Actinomycetes bacterium]
MRVLAIDQGTSATKAVVVDVTADSLTVQSDVDVVVGGLRYDGDAVEVDAANIWDSILEAGQRALTGLPKRSGPPVDCVGIGNQGETVLAWRRSTGDAVTPALVWQDRRAVSVTDRLQASRARIEQITGLPLDPYFAAAKMTWVRGHLLDESQRDDPDVVVTTLDSWVLHRATGAFVTDAATASRTQLFDLDRTAWSDDACTAFAVKPEQLPEIVPCDTSIGETGAFGGSVPVTGLVVDQQAALFAQDCRTTGSSKCTYGTGAFLLANIGRTAHRSHNGLAASVAWQTGGDRPDYCLDGQVYTVGAAVSWLQRIGLISGPTDLDDLASSVTDDGGVVFVPSLAGVGAPRWVPEARGSFSGLSLSTERAHLVRAVVQGIAAQVTMLARAVEDDLGAPLTALRVDGGLTRSSMLMQLQADLLGIPVEVYPYSCATALGVAAFAARGHAGVGTELAITSGWTARRVFEPTLSRAAAEEVYGRWLAALDASIAEAHA